MANLSKPSSSGPWLLSLISAGKLTPKQLTTHQRRICIRYLLAEKKYTQNEIAQILGVDPAIITRAKKRIREENFWMLDAVDERHMAIDIMHTAEMAIARLFKQGKEKDAWTVARELVETMQNLGYVKRKPIEFVGDVGETLQKILSMAAQRPIDQIVQNGEIIEAKSTDHEGPKDEGRLLRTADLGGSAPAHN